MPSGNSASSSSTIFSVETLSIEIESLIIVSSVLDSILMFSERFYSVEQAWNNKRRIKPIFIDFFIY